MTFHPNIAKGAEPPLSAAIEKLFKQAIANLKADPKNNNAVGKLYEVRVLYKVLEWLLADGYQIKHHSPPSSKGIMVLPAKPASANKKSFSWFSATKPNDELEVWTSLQFLTLSYGTYKGAAAPQTHAARHELDVGVFRGPLTQRYPKHTSIVFGASCKSTSFKKDYLRELLGLGRETSLLTGKKKSSLAPWFKTVGATARYIRSQPASPIALFCSDLTVANYNFPVNELGVFPYYYPP